MSDREYRYPGHFRWLRNAMAGVTALGAFCTFDAFTRTASSDTVYRLRFAFIFVLCMALTILAYSVWRFLARLASTRVRLSENRFEYADARRGANLRYGEIGVVKAAGGPYFGGWLTVHGAGKRLPIHLELEDISEFVTSLKANLDAKRRQDAYRVRELYGFLQWAKFTEVFLTFLRKRTLTLVVFSYVAGFLAYLAAHMEGSGNPVWFLVGALFPWGVAAVYAMYVKKLVSKTAHRDEFVVYDPDPARLGRAWRTAGKAGIIVFLVWTLVRVVL